MNLDNFITELKSKCSIKYSDDNDIKNLIDPILLEKDNPVSQGKRLKINRLCIDGIKNNGEIINYDKKFFKGINILYAQNGKGKSSIFKIIKFALTGDKSPIKRDVLGWLQKIILEFSVGDTIYTVYIDLMRPRVKSGLYRCNIDSLSFNLNGEVSIEELLIHFEENTEKAFMKNMQQFFFEQFSYYLLLWTSSSKNSFDLTDNRTTWKTYYKSIYLESKDYDALFLSQDMGSQNKKILEMLLGLKYTASINTWSNKKDHLENHLRQLDYITTNDELVKDDTFELNNELNSIKDEINKVKHLNREMFKKTLDIQFYNQNSKDLFMLEKQSTEIKMEMNKLEEELKKTKRRLNSLKEEKEFGYYFSNLSIKQCPRCEHEIKNERKEIEKTTHKCMLCEEELDILEDNQYLEGKIQELEKYKKDLSSVMSEMARENQKINQKQETLNEQLLEHEGKIISFEIEEKLIESLPSLIERRIEIESLINQKGVSDVNQKKGRYEEEVKIYDFAITYFRKLRVRESKAILDSLCKIIKQRVNDFGLENINDVTINENLDILFLQNNINNKFNDLNEGEQLRAKLAVVLSLVVLDIEFNVGRHPRLLIIDSPGKEEVISEDLISLASIFKEIEKEFANELQIIIGTALEEFKNASVSTKVDVREFDENFF
ncbi:hypothetical protein [Sporosarcina newyorkensis]|uniref:hypothetical protein n=1 Tax=Sporosarcina newyorkensis TaxID=759851 RepID=UPI003CFD456A